MRKFYGRPEKVPKIFFLITLFEIITKDQYDDDDDDDDDDEDDALFLWYG